MKKIDTQLHTIEEALADIKKGKIIIVVDDEDRENEGDFVAAAELTTPEMVNFMTIHGRGLICTPLPESRCEVLDLHMMVGKNTDPKETAFTISVDLLGHGVTTGISASDRSKTIVALMNDDTKPNDLSRPGHIFPLRAKKGGVLRRPGHTEAAVDLAKLAGLKEGGVIVEIMNEDGSMARLPELLLIAKKFDLKIISIEDLIAYRLLNDSLIKKNDELIVNTHFGVYKLSTYLQTNNNQVHFALSKGEWTKDDEVLVRVKSTNSYFDLFNSLQYGENPLLEKVTGMINAAEKGVIVFINNAIDADSVMGKLARFKDSLENKTESIPLPMDDKDYGIGAQIIKDLGITKIKLITRHPTQKKAISGYGLEIVDFINID